MGALQQLPGVHAVGVGAKVVGGLRTDDVAIAVFVAKKKTGNELPREEGLSSMIEGVNIDVIEMARPRLLGGVPIIDPKVEASGTLPGDGFRIVLKTSIDPPPVGLSVVIELRSERRVSSGGFGLGNGR